MRLNSILFALALLLFSSCRGMQNDLLPSGQDKQPVAQQGTTGAGEGQYAPDFAVSDTLGNMVTLSSATTGHKAIVLYFTMWCPICDTDMTLIRSQLIPAYTDVAFYAVDYVSGSVSAARNAEVSNGYDGSGFTVLADTDQAVLNAFGATMGSTIVIDQGNVIRMNESFKDGSKLTDTLAALR